MYGLERHTYLCLKGDTCTDYHTAFATDELRATPPTVLCSVSLSNTLYHMETDNSAASVFITICAGRRTGMGIIMKNAILSVLICALLLSFMVSTAIAEYRTTTPDEVKALLDDGRIFTVVDVRRPDEYAEAHIPGAINIDNESIGDI